MQEENARKGQAALVKNQAAQRDARAKGNDLVANKLAMANEIKQKKLNDKAAIVSFKV